MQELTLAEAGSRGLVGRDGAGAYRGVWPRLCDFPGHFLLLRSLLWVQRELDCGGEVLSAWIPAILGCPGFNGGGLRLRVWGLVGLL